MVCPLGQVTKAEPLPVLRQRLGGQLDGHRYVRAGRPTVPHAVGLDAVLGRKRRKTARCGDTRSMEQDPIQEVKDRLTYEPTVGSGLLPLIPDVGDAF